MPTDDDAFGAGSIREDGRALHPTYLFEVKIPGGEQGALGLLQAGGHHADGPGLPPSEPGRLPHGARMIARRTLLAASAVAAFAPRARAQGARIKLGVLNDMSGPYRDTGGPLSVTCVQQAVQDFGDHGFAVDVISADHGNKPDQGASIARRWIDAEGVDCILDVPTSSVALAVNTVVREKNKVYINSGAGTTDLTGPQCSPNTVQWTYDVYMLAKSTGGAMVKAGGDSWFFVTADYVFGQQLASEASTFVKAAGGKVLGEVRYPSRPPPTSPPSCCRRRPRAPRCSAWRMPARTPSTASSRRPNSG